MRSSCADNRWRRNGEPSTMTRQLSIGQLRGLRRRNGRSHGAEPVPVVNEPVSLVAVIHH